jgi:hypothetical protein
MGHVQSAGVVSIRSSTSLAVESLAARQPNWVYSGEPALGSSDAPTVYQGTVLEENLTPIMTQCRR